MYFLQCHRGWFVTQTNTDRFFAESSRYLVGCTILCICTTAAQSSASNLAVSVA